MKQLLFAMLMLTATLTAQSQYINGVQVTGTTSSLIEKFKAKGWVFIKNVEGVPYLKGSIGNYSGCEMFIYSTKSKQAAKVVVYLSEQANWSNLKSRYKSIVDVYTEKLGQPDVDNENFEYPYESGDGYESTAVRSEKANINSVWFDIQNGNYEVSISKYMSVKIVCENVINMRIRTKENDNSLFD